MTLEYKGYTANVEVDWASSLIFGRVDQLDNVVTFKSETVTGAAQAFRDSVDDWLAFRASTAFREALYCQITDFLESKGFLFVDFGNWAKDNSPGIINLSWRNETLLLGTFDGDFKHDSGNVEIESFDQFKALFDLITVYAGDSE